MKDRMKRYRLWWECLSLSQPENWSDEVIEAFEPGRGMTFEQWWKVCGHRFELPEPYLLNVSDTDMDEIVLVEVNLLARKEDLKKAFKKLLDERHLRKRGRPTFDDFADWPMKGDLNIESAKKALRVWKYAKENPDMSNLMVAKECKISLGLLEGVPDASSRKSINKQIKRYKEYAERLIRGVEQGDFPARENRPASTSR